MAKYSKWDQLPLVEVRWLDAALDPQSSAELENPGTINDFGGMKTCRDIGYLVYKDRKIVKLALSLCEEDNDFRHSNTIPRGWIKEIIPLTRPQPADTPHAEN